jgi:hypothetical protein
LVPPLVPPVPPVDPEVFEVLDAVAEVDIPAPVDPELEPEKLVVPTAAVVGPNPLVEKLPVGVEGPVQPVLIEIETKTSSQHGNRIRPSIWPG